MLYHPILDTPSVSSSVSRQVDSLRDASGACAGGEGMGPQSSTLEALVTWTLTSCCLEDGLSFVLCSSAGVGLCSASFASFFGKIFLLGIEF